MKYIKLETHCHCLGGSGCASAKSEEIIEEYQALGYGGVVLTNHLNQACFNAYKGNSKNEKYDYWYSLVDDLKEKRQRSDFKIFCGMEVQVRSEIGAFQEFMLYGFKKSFLYNHKPLFTYTQEELFRLADENGIFMYQTHPFRNGVFTGNPFYMHGAEAFNGNSNHNNHNEEAEDFCLKNKLIQMSGSDYHAGGQKICAGIVIPDDISDEQELTNYIFNKKIILIKNNV